MRHVIALLALLLVVFSVGAATAADLRVSSPEVSTRAETWRYNRHGDTLPFARTKRSESVYASSSCWSQCQSYCTWNEAACLDVDAQGRCLRVTDACDRSCQRDCRTRGGPFLSFDYLLGD